MDLNKAKEVLSHNNDDTRCLWHRDTNPALEWAIAEVERLQKANHNLISEGPRVFTSGTPLASLPELRNVHNKLVMELDQRRQAHTPHD